MKLPYIVAGMILCGLVSCSEHDGKKQKEHINNNQENRVHLKCDPNCTFEQRLEQQYHLNPNIYIDKNDSPWVVEQKQNFILDSLPNDYNFETNPAKNLDLGGIEVKDGLSFEFNQHQISDNYLYLKSHTRESYNQAGDFMWWYKNLLLDTKNQKVLGINDIVNDETSKNQIVEIIAKSSVGEHLLQSCYSQCENPESKQSELTKRATDIFEHNWELTNSSIQWCYQTGGNFGQPALVGNCIILTEEQAKQLIKPEFLN